MNKMQKIKIVDDKIYILYDNHTIKKFTKQSLKKYFSDDQLAELFDNWHKAKLNEKFQMIVFKPDWIQLDRYTIEELEEDVTLDEYLKLLQRFKNKKQKIIEATLNLLF